MTYFERVQQAANAKDAMTVLAQGIDEILASLKPQPTDPFMKWRDEPPILNLDGFDRTAAATELYTATHTEDTAVVEIKPPSPQKQAARRMFEQQSLKLTATYGDTEDWPTIYAKGGPLWLYMADRDLVMSLPFDTRQRMVNDVLEDDPVTAQEMGRDILKFAGESGPGSTGMMVADEY